MSNKTLNFYNNHAKDLIQRYDQAEMSSLQNLLLEYISNNSSVLDIGFGSGRDLDFLYNNGYEIWGVDPVSVFVKHMQNKYPQLHDHFVVDKLPLNQAQLQTSKRFDAYSVQTGQQTRSISRHF